MKKTKRIKLFNELEKNFTPLGEKVLRIITGGDVLYKGACINISPYYVDALLASWVNDPDYVEASIIHHADGSVTIYISPNATYDPATGRYDTELELTRITRNGEFYGLYFGDNSSPVVAAGHTHTWKSEGTPGECERLKDVFPEIFHYIYYNGREYECK